MANAPVPSETDSQIILPEHEPCCQGPCDLPWIDHNQCLTFRETRTTSSQLEKLVRDRDVRGTIVTRLVYTHTLCLIGKQQGGLVYSLTLLPGETATLYHSDRHRRTTSETQRFSVVTSFSQFTSALDQRRQTGDTSRLNELVTGKVNASASGSADIEIWDLGVKGGGSFSSSSVDTKEVVTTRNISDQFVSTLRQASQFTEMQHSITVSTYEDKETMDTTKRVLVNPNRCYAVNYFVRRVLDVYELSTELSEVTFQIETRGHNSGWLTPEQIDLVPPELGEAVKAALAGLPEIGETVEHPTRISVPTDGVVYQPELAHCCAQDPALEAASLIALEREKAEAQKIALEAQLMALEVQRRQALIAAGTLDPFAPAEPRES